MMNKKRLAALAMSAVMAAGTVSIPVNAADFSDGAAVQEEVAVQSVDVTEEDPDAVGAIEIEVVGWGDDMNTPSLTVKVNGEEETYTKGFEKQEIPATCTQKGGYKWYIEIYGEPFLSPLVETVDMLGHAYGEEYTREDPAATCTVDGTLKTFHKCTREGCGHEEEVGEVTIPAKGHTIDPNAETTKITYVVDETASTDDGKHPYNTELDSTGNVVLSEPTQPGAYIVRTEGLCTVCGEADTIEKLETLKAGVVKEKGIKIIATENIKDDVIYTEATFDNVAELPKAEDIELEECNKSASYTYVVYGTDGNIVNTVEVPVDAHHVFKPLTEKDYEPVDAKEDGYLTAKLNDKGELVVTNNTCLKDVKYNIKKTCSVCGNVVKEEKVAPKSTKHSLSKAVQTLQGTIQGYVNNKIVKDYDVLLDEIKAVDKNGKFVKVVNVTATCDKKGTADVEFYCQVCGEKAATVSGVEVTMEHHPATKTENRVEPTCQAEGSYDSISYCDRCGKELSKTHITLDKLAHTNESKETEVSIDFKGGTVYGDGKYKVGDKFDTVIGEEGVDKLPQLTAYVITNCTACHDNEKVLMDGEGKPAKAVDIKIVALTKETYDKYGSVIKAGNITVKATYTTAENETVTAETTVPYFSKTDLKIDDQAKNGLWKDEDGVYRYYINGDFAEDYAGIAEYGDGEFFVANGLLCKDANGLNLYDGTWYMLSGGQIQRNYTDLALYDGEWFYLTNGELDEEVNGLVNYDGGQFLVINGRLGREVNGLWQNFDGDWYYLANGQVQNQYTGVAQYDGAFFYVVNGVLDSDYNGTVEYDGETFKVVNGMLQ